MSKPCTGRPCTGRPCTGLSIRSAGPDIGEANVRGDASALRAGKYEVWRGSIDPDMVTAILASRSLHVRETTPMPDDKADITKFDLDLTSLTSVWTQLAASCASVASAPKSPSPAVPWQSTVWSVSPWTANPVPNVGTTPSATPTQAQGAR
jgi:hypothetical protein